jgi:hypothetical protein
MRIMGGGAVCVSDLPGAGASSAFFSAAEASPVVAGAAAVSAVSPFHQHQSLDGSLNLFRATHR